MSTMAATDRPRTARRQFTDEFKAARSGWCSTRARRSARWRESSILTESAPRQWAARGRADPTAGRTGVTIEEREELRRLRKEVRTLRTEREIPKKAAAFFAKEHV